MIRHEDGSVRFWDVSSAGIRLLYKLTTADMFGGYYRGDMSDIDADEEWPPFRKVFSLTVFLYFFENITDCRVVTHLICH